jgi:copper resistance protein D
MVDSSYRHPNSDAMLLPLILARWVHLSASILLASLFLFELVILVPATRMQSASAGPLLGKFRDQTFRAASWTILIALISWAIWSWLVAAAMTGDDLIACLEKGDCWTVLITTQFGHTCLFRVLIGLLSGTFLWQPWRRSGKHSVLLATLMALSTVHLVSLAWIGHAAADSGPFRGAHLLGDAIHLLASACWPGALAPLAAFFLLVLKTSRIKAIELAAPVVQRFSASSLIAVAVLAATGLSNSIFMVGNFRSLLTTAYGQLLISKIILFFAMVAFGALNLFLLKPKVSAEVFPMGVGERNRAAHLLLRNVLWELGLGTVVLLIVGLLGVSAPPMR